MEAKRIILDMGMEPDVIQGNKSEIREVIKPAISYLRGGTIADGGAPLACIFKAGGGVEIAPYQQGDILLLGSGPGRVCVLSVRAERLQDILPEDCVKEGAVQYPDYTKRGCLCLHDSYVDNFAEAWDSKIRPADRAFYSWAANPWVWAIKFKLCVD